MAESLDGSEDFICRFGPLIRLGIFIVPLDEGSDICPQLLRRGMDAATNLLAGELGKPALGLILINLERRVKFGRAAFVMA